MPSNSHHVPLESGPCDRCYSHSESLTPITTVVNGIEQKEWVCETCEPEAREDEKPPKVIVDG